MRQRHTDGFIVPLAAIGLALLALGLSMNLPADEQAGLELRRAQDRVALEQAAIIAEARVSYLMMSEPAGLRGLEIGAGRLAVDGSFRPGEDQARMSELVFDSRPYRLAIAGHGTFILRLQDEAGLVGVNASNTGLLASLAEICDLDGAERQALNLYRTRTPAGTPAFLARQVRPAMLGAISTEPAATLPRLPTAPASVILSATRGNQQLAEETIRQRDNREFTANVNAFRNQNDFNAHYRHFSWGSVSNTIRIYVEPFQPSLNLRLPLYYYSSRVIAEDNNPELTLLTQGSTIHAGSRTQCYQSPGEAVVPLPYPGQPVS